MKTCPKCGVEKSLSLFNKNRNRKDGVSCYCKECVQANSKQHYELNKEKRLAQTQSYYRINKDTYTSYKQSWRNANRAKDRYASSKRRAAEKAAIPPWFESEKVAIVFEKAKAFCMQTDHIVPLVSDKVCGLHCWANLQLLDAPLNQAKSNREWPDMWDEEVYGRHAT